jgi:hypothetical protein
MVMPIQGGASPAASTPVLTPVSASNAVERPVVVYYNN